MEIKVLELNTHSLINIKKRLELIELIKKICPDINYLFQIIPFIVLMVLAIIIKNNIKHEVINPPIIKSKIETTIIKIWLKRYEIVIAGVYNPEKLDSRDLLSILKLHKHVLIVGDLNARSTDWNCYSQNSNGIHLKKFLIDHIEEVQIYIIP